VLLSLALVAIFLVIVWQSRRSAEGRRGFPRYFRVNRYNYDTEIGLVDR